MLRQQRHRWPFILALTVVGTVYVILAIQQLSYGIEYDEGSNLTLLVNFAHGRGYTSTGLLPWTWSKAFDPGASTGPVVLMPGALLWWISGGSLELTRLVPIAFFAALILGLGLLFKRLGGAWAGLIAAASPLLLAVGKEDISTVSLVPGRFVGEIAATSMLVVAALLLSISRDTGAIGLFVAGIAGGLAIQSKVHFVLPVLVLIVTWLLLESLTGRRRSRLTWLCLLGGIVLPTLMFEAFRLFSLGLDGYVVSVKDLVAWLISQGGNASAEPFLDSAARRLGGLLSVYSFGGALVVCAALAVLIWLALAGLGGIRVGAAELKRSRALVAVASLSLAISAVFVWWMFVPPEKLPRVGIPILLVATPILLVSVFTALRNAFAQTQQDSQRLDKVLIVGMSWVLGVGGLLVLVMQGLTAAKNDFGARMLEEQRAAAVVISNSGTPSLRMDWIWNLAQFQLLSGVPSETKPGVGAPTISVFDSIRARVDYGVDDARAFIATCDRVLYSSQSSVVCADVE